MNENIHKLTFCLPNIGINERERKINSITHVFIQNTKSEMKEMKSKRQMRKKNATVTTVATLTILT